MILGSINSQSITQKNPHQRLAVGIVRNQKLISRRDHGVDHCSFCGYDQIRSYQVKFGAACRRDDRQPRRGDRQNDQYHL